jgi:hypothetical protein
VKQSSGQSRTSVPKAEGYRTGDPSSFPACRAQMSDTSASHVGATLLRPVASSGNRFIDQTCRTFFCHGREKLLGVVEILERDKFAGFLAVAGNDSSEIFGDRIASANVIITDENDLEFSIFQSDVFRDFWRSTELSSHGDFCPDQSLGGRNTRFRILIP